MVRTMMMRQGSRGLFWTIALIGAAVIASAGGRVAMAAAAIPTIPAQSELVIDSCPSSVIHGWHSNRLLKYRGELYASATQFVPGLDAQSNQWNVSGVFLKRGANGKWTKVGAVPNDPYFMLMDPKGVAWAVTPLPSTRFNTLRMSRPLDFGSFTEVNDGACWYMGVGMSPEGNFLSLSAERGDMQAWNAQSLVSSFYDNATGKWHYDSIPTPEGRYGYVGIILKGHKAIAVLNSAIADPKANPTPPHYSWRHVRLARCDDLTKGPWVNVGFLMPEFGNTSLQDIMEGPDGKIYLVYSANGAASVDELKKTPMRHYIARINDDLTTEVFPTGINASSTRLLADSKGHWYLMGRAGAGDLHLWRVDPDNGFKPNKEWVLRGTKMMEAYVIHALRPVRFGGEDDGDTIHLLTARYIKAADGVGAHAQLWHSAFKLPAGQ